MPKQQRSKPGLKVPIPGTPVRVREGGGSGNTLPSGETVNGPEMARKNITTTTTTTAKQKVCCGVCNGAIVEGKSTVKVNASCGTTVDALALLEELTDSEEPFHCVICSRTILKHQVRDLEALVRSLQDEVKIIPTLQATIAALSEEITKMQQSGNSLTESSSYAQVVSAGIPGQPSRQVHQLQQAGKR